jgi:hypothetical protein
LGQRQKGRFSNANRGRLSINGFHSKSGECRGIDVTGSEGFLDRKGSHSNSEGSMTMDQLKEFLLYSFVLNYGMLIFWGLMFWFWRDGMYRLHRRWFRLSEEQFDSSHHFMMSIYKIGIIMFNLVPLLALCLMKS